MTGSTESKGPLGVFDSGVGGLTVVAALLRRFPHERVLYIADQAHVPYGGRPLHEVFGFASGISAFLAREGCRAIVMACNISSATALPSVSEQLDPLPVLGVIAAAAARAAEGDSPRVGVLATEGTVRTHAYAEQIRGRNAGAHVMEVPCSRFVPLVEAGETESVEAAQACRVYLTPLAEAGCRRIILGCTHYPYLLPALRREAAGLFPQTVEFIDPADEMADALCAALPDMGIRSPGVSNLLLTTGDPDAFRAQAARFLVDVDFDVAPALWTADGRLDYAGRALRRKSA